MSATPGFAAAPIVGAANLAGFDASLTGPSSFSTVVTGGASGTKIEEIDVIGLATTAAEVVNLFLHNGSTWFLFDQILVTAVTSSTTAVAYRTARTYTNLWVPNGWTLRASHTVTTNDNKLAIEAFGGDL